MSLINKVEQFNDDVDIAHQIVHGDSTTTVATEGGPVRSLAKLIADKDAEFVGGDVVQQAMAARDASESARDVAVLAKDAAMVGTVTYPDEATGRAAVADGEYFKVIGSGDVAAREYRRTNASTSVLVAEYPSIAASEKVKNYFEDDIIVSLTDFVAGSDESGSAVETDTVFKSPVFPYIPGSNVVMSRPSVGDLRYGFQFSNEANGFTRPIWHWGESSTVSHPTAKYVKFYLRNVNGSLTLNKNEVVTSGINFKTLSYKQNSNREISARVLNNFSDVIITPHDFVLGDDNAFGEIDATNRAKTKPYYLKDGGTLTLFHNTYSDSFQVIVNVAVSDNPETGFGTKQSFTGNQFTVTAEKPFFKIYAWAVTFDFEKFKAMPNLRVSSSVGFKLALEMTSDIQRVKESIKNLKNDTEKFTVTERDFSKGFTNLGTIKLSDSYLQTKPFKVKAGDVVTISCPASTPKFVWNVGYGIDEIPTQAQKDPILWYGETSFSVTIPDEMNYISFIASKDGQSIITDEDLSKFKFSAVLNKTKEQELYDYTQQADNPIKTFMLSVNDFEFGQLDNVYTEQGIFARSKLTYKFPPNKTIKLTAPISKLLDVTAILSTSYDSSRIVNIVTDAFTDGTKVINTTEEMQYVRIYIKTKNNVIINRDQFYAYTDKINISFVDEVAHQSDLSEMYYQLNSNNGGLTKFIESVGTNYRTPSKAIGGVVSFIDDDGRTELFTQLYPFVVANGIPYGFAITPGKVGDAGYATSEQIVKMSRDKSVEFQSHTWSHVSLAGSTPEIIEYQIRAAKEWFIQRGIYVSSFVYPFGHDSSLTHSILTQYYDAAYDFGNNFVETFDTINNFSIRRWILNFDSDIASLKAAIDQAHATNGWIVITTHAGLVGYWDETMPAKILEIYNYALGLGCKVVKPSEGFQTFGNIVENDSGFKIQANGKIVGAIL